MACWCDAGMQLQQSENLRLGAAVGIFHFFPMDKTGQTYQFVQSPLSVTTSTVGPQSVNADYEIPMDISGWDLNTKFPILGICILMSATNFRSATRPAPTTPCPPTPMATPLSATMRGTCFMNGVQEHNLYLYAWLGTIPSSISFEYRQ